MNDKTINYLQPFIMIGGDDSEETVFKKFEHYKKMGIYSAVLQYTGPGTAAKDTAPLAGLMQISRFDDIYFRTLEYMVDACKKLGMTFWVQDAAPFPTGAADGAFMEKENLDKGKFYLEERHTTIRGPLKNAAILAENFNGLPRGSVPEMMADLNPQGPEASQRGELLGAVMIKYADASTAEDMRFDSSTAVDVSAHIDMAQGILRIDVPEGLWRLFFIYKTRRGGRKYYMNLLDDASVRLQIERVLQLHYEHLKDELGKTWEGFFYDEPEVGNTNYYDFHCLPKYNPHKTPAALPWSRQLPQLMAGRLGSGWLCQLPLLWYNDAGENDRLVRFHYMDAVTRLISENYNGQILPWCRKRGIRYIGHVLEDENSHARLGCGTGHFFRTEKYQDMSGVDLIGGQVLPGLDMYGVANYGVADGDGTFYHYGLAKLASSEAHINPDKLGSFCEVNAVYNNISNARFYKFLIDHLFVNGITQLVPVITESLTVPEGKLLWDYANRMCHLLDRSGAVNPVAILYHAESEWAGNCQFFQRPAAALAQAQISYDVVPADALVEKDFYRTQIGDGVLTINGNIYKAFVVPYCEYIRRDVFEVITEMIKHHVPVFFIDDMPKGYCETVGNIHWPSDMKVTVPLCGLAKAVRAAGTTDISCDGSEPFMRYAHWQKDGRDFYFLANEEPERKLQTIVHFPLTKPVMLYDVMHQRQFFVNAYRENGMTHVPVTLGKYESCLFVFGDDLPETECNAIAAEPMNILTEEKTWQVTVYRGMETEKQIYLSELQDISLIDNMARYTEPLHYEISFDVDAGMTLPHWLDLGEVCDSADVILNGVDLGMCIAAPYRYDISKAIEHGRNTLCICVLPPVARKRCGDIPPVSEAMTANTYAVMPPVGLLGPVRFLGE